MFTQPFIGNVLLHETKHGLYREHYRLIDGIPWTCVDLPEPADNPVWEDFS